MTSLPVKMTPWPQILTSGPTSCVRTQYPAYVRMTSLPCERTHDVTPLRTVLLKKYSFTTVSRSTGRPVTPSLNGVIIITHVISRSTHVAYVRMTSSTYAKTADVFLAGNLPWMGKLLTSFWREKSRYMGGVILLMIYVQKIF